MTIRAGAALALVVAAAAAAGVLARADTPFEPVLAALKQAEGNRGPRRLALIITQRDAVTKSGEAFDDLRQRLREARDGVTVTGTMLAGRAGWRKDWDGSAAQPGGTGIHTTVVALKETHRTLVEATEEGQKRRQAILATAASTTPGDAILGGQLGGYLATYQFTDRIETGDQVQLSLRRGEEALLLTAPRARPLQFTRLRLDRPVPGAATSARQVYEAVVEWSGDEIRRVEEVISTPAPYRRAAYREMVVKSQEPAADESELLNFKFPAGTAVRDQRFRFPVEYEQGEQDAPEAQIRRLAEEAGSQQVQVGEAATGFTLTGDRGDTVRLTSLRGKVVLLFWYAPWSEACAREAAELERDFARKFPPRSLQVIGIQVASEGDPLAAAKAYRARYGLTFPLLLDAPAATFRQLGPGDGVPQVVLIDRAGRIRFADTGWNRDALRQQLDLALEDDASGNPKAPMLRDPKKGKR
jgi:peroxiredoxin